MAADGSNINPVALNFLNAKNPDGTFVIPSPQTSASGVNYTAVVPGSYNEDQFNTNFDVNLRPADRLSAKFFFSNSNQKVPFFGASCAWLPGTPLVSEPESWQSPRLTFSRRERSTNSALASLVLRVKASTEERSPIRMWG